MTTKKCTGYYQGVLISQVSLHDKAAPFGTITKCVDYAGVLIFKCPNYITGFTVVLQLHKIIFFAKSNALQNILIPVLVCSGMKNYIY